MFIAVTGSIAQHHRPVIRTGIYISSVQRLTEMPDKALHLNEALLHKLAGHVTSKSGRNYGTATVAGVRKWVERLKMATRTCNRQIGGAGNLGQTACSMDTPKGKA